GAGALPRTTATLLQPLLCRQTPCPADPPRYLQTSKKKAPTISGAFISFFLRRRVVAVGKRRQQDKSAVPVQRNGGQLEGKTLVAGAQQPRRTDRHPSVLHFRTCNVLRWGTFTSLRPTGRSRTFGNAHTHHPFSHAEVWGWRREQSFSMSFNIGSQDIATTQPPNPHSNRNNSGEMLPLGADTTHGGYPHVRVH